VDTVQAARRASPGAAAPRAEDRPPRTVGELLDACQRDRTDWASLTGESKKNLEARLAQVKAIIGPDTTLDRLTDARLARCRDELNGTGNRIGTVNRKMADLRTALNWGAELGYCRPFKIKMTKDPDGQRIRWLTPAEEERLLLTLADHGESDVADLVVVALATGCRRGELLTAAKGQYEDGWLTLHRTKGGTARSVPVVGEARVIMDRWFQKDREILCPVTKDHLRTAWARARKAMHLDTDADFVFHALRHTCATRLVKRDVNLAVIQEYLGHADIKTTLRYVHVSKPDLRRAAEILAAPGVGQ